MSDGWIVKDFGTTTQHTTHEYTLQFPDTQHQGITPSVFTNVRNKPEPPGDAAGVLYVRI